MKPNLPALITALPDSIDGSSPALVDSSTLVDDLASLPTSRSIPSGLSIELRSAVLQLTRRIRQEGTADVVTPSEFSVLAILDKHGPTTPGTLAEHEQIQPPSMTRTLANLAAKGYVSKAKHPSDKRQVLIVLTDEGREVVKETRRRRDAWLARRLAGLAPEQLATLADAARIMRTMTTQK